MCDRVSNVHRDKLHGLLQFQGRDAKFLHEDVMDCVASKCTFEGSEPMSSVARVVILSYYSMISTEKGHENADFFDGGVPYQSRRVFPRRGGLR